MAQRANLNRSVADHLKLAASLLEGDGDALVAAQVHATMALTLVVASRSGADMVMTLSDLPMMTVMSKASGPYSDHPDFDPSWTVEGPR